MINVELIQASDGDCIWIEYGEDENTLHRILIDGGKSGTFKHLKSRIEKLPQNARHFDLLVITYIDADHIAGVLKLLEADDLGITFEDIWFNGKANGAFTYAALKTLNELDEGASYKDCYKAIRKILPHVQYPQTPQIMASRYQKNTWKVFEA